MKTSLLLSSIAIALTACGGGSDSDPVTKDSPFKGSHEAASINVATAPDMAREYLGVIAENRSFSNNSSGGNNQKSRRLQRALITTPSAPIIGNCGGRMMIETVTDDEGVPYRWISSTTHFENYCQNNNVTDGAVTVTNNGNSAAVSFTNLIYGEQGSQFTYAMNGNGSSSFDFNEARFQLSLHSAHIVRSPDNVEYLMENFTYDQRYDDLNNTRVFSMSFSGRVYQSTMGYVMVSTQTPFRFNTRISNNPSQGSLTMTGDNNSKMILTAMAADMYQLEVDEDGDGNADSITTGQWDELEITFLFQ